jgi:hypothetical protein
MQQIIVVKHSFSKVLYKIGQLCVNLFTLLNVMP